MQAKQQEHSEVLIVSDILEKPFPNVKFDDIYKSLPIIGGSLTGDHEQHTQSYSENYHTSQIRADVEMVEFSSEVGTELSNVRCTQSFAYGSFKCMI